LYNTIILPDVLYACATWVSHVVGGTKDEVVREQGAERISGPKRDEVTDEWRIHNKDIKHMYSLNIIRVITSTRIRWTGHDGCTVQRCPKGSGGVTCGKETTWQIQAQMGG